jgi:hypothetical protein
VIPLSRGARRGGRPTSGTERALKLVGSGLIMRIGLVGGSGPRRKKDLSFPEMISIQHRNQKKIHKIIYRPDKNIKKFLEIY